MSLMLQRAGFMSGFMRMKFDGANDYVDVGNFTLAQDDWTFCAWINTSKSSGDLQPIGSTTNGQFLRIRGGDFRPFVEDLDGERASINTGIGVADGADHLLVISIDYNGRVKVFVDRAEVGDEASSFSGGLDGATMSIGRINNDDFFEGIIKQAIVVNSALQLSDVQAIFDLKPTGIYTNTDTTSHWINTGSLNSNWLDLVGANDGTTNGSPEEALYPS